MSRSQKQQEGAGVATSVWLRASEDGASVRGENSSAEVQRVGRVCVVRCVKGYARAVSADASRMSCPRAVPARASGRAPCDDFFGTAISACGVFSCLRRVRSSFAPFCRCCGSFFFVSCCVGPPPACKYVNLFMWSFACLRRRCSPSSPRSRRQCGL